MFVPALWSIARTRTLPASALLAFMLCLLAGSFVPAARAQYMYLDANGDGVNTAADVVSPSGTTTLDLWLHTDQNRDGSHATCSTGEALSIDAYEFVLRATNGKVNWLAFTNLQAGMSTNTGAVSSATEYHNGQAGGPFLPPGTYHLASIQVSVSLGTPSIGIVSSAALGATLLTAFTSECSGSDLDNALKLGSDWFDTDGVAYGGPQQAPPVLAPIADMSVNEGETAQQTITATDADLQPLTFAKESGPDYMTVATTDPGSATAHGTITLAPPLGHLGGSAGSVSVTDGIATDVKSFGITVNGVNDPPSIAAYPQLTVPVGTAIRPEFSVVDADADFILVHLAGAASFVAPFLFGPSSGYSSLGSAYDVEPQAADVGTGYVVIEATDGVNVARKRVEIDVPGVPLAPRPRGDLYAGVFSAEELAGPPSAVAMGDLTGDAKAEAAIASEITGFVDIYTDDGQGGLMLIERVDGLSPGALAIGDLDHDGIGDLVLANVKAGAIDVLRGPFRGSTHVSQELQSGRGPVALALADLNRDGYLDVVVVNRADATIAVFLNDGTGSLHPAVSYATAPYPVGVAVGDFNGDSWPDVAVTCHSPRVLDIFPGAGGGALGSATTQALPNLNPVSVAATDWNHDGRLDLLVASDGVGSTIPGVAILIGSGTGTFSSNLSIFSATACMAVGDLDQDGKPDLIAGVNRNNSSIDLYFHDWGLGALESGGGFRGTPQCGGPIVGVAIGDLDGDGLPDVVDIQQTITAFDTTVNGIAAVYKNRGGGRLTEAWVGPATSKGPHVLADFNNDGHLDVAGWEGVYLGNGDGTFSVPKPGGVPSTGFSSQTFAADLNGDGNLDIVSVPLCCHTVTILLGDGTGAFTSGPLFSTEADQNRTVALGDLNEDGHPDLVVSGGSLTRAFQVYWGHGDATFSAGPTLSPGRYSPTEMHVLDLDADGHADIVYADEQPWIIRGHGDGTFDGAAPLSSADWTTWILGLGDLNNDGRADFVVQSQGHACAQSVLLGTPGGALGGPRIISTAAGWLQRAGWRTVPMFDADGDGRADILSPFLNTLALAKGDGLGGAGQRRLFGPLDGFAMIGDVNEDGWPDIVQAGGGEEFYSGDQPLLVYLNRSDIINRRAARAFQQGESKTIPIGAPGRNICFHVEPVDGSFQAADLDPRSIVMISIGTGSVSRIAAVTSKPLVVGDTDGNGVADLAACFASADLSRLFSLIRGRQTVPVAIEGRISTGGRMHAEISLTIVPTGVALAPTLAPNPLNPAGTFRFVTSRAGRVAIRLFDVQGRLVRVVADRSLPSGEQSVFFDGRSDDGRALASGVYYARIETTDGVYRKRVAIVK